MSGRKHENADRLMPGETLALWRDDDPHKPLIAAMLVEQFRCLDCGAWLSLGSANDKGEAVAIEMRAASLAGAPRQLVRSSSRLFVGIEWEGWRQVETFERLTVVDTNGREHEDHDVPINLDSTRWQAGYLARCIHDHAPAEESTRMFPMCIGTTQLAPANSQCMRCERYGQKCAWRTAEQGGAT